VEHRGFVDRRLPRAGRRQPSQRGEQDYGAFGAAALQSLPRRRLDFAHPLDYAADAARRIFAAGRRSRSSLVLQQQHEPCDNHRKARGNRDRSDDAQRVR